MYYPIWALWRATGKTHLISEIMNEPYHPMAVVMEIDHLYDIIKEQMEEESEDGEE